MDISGIFTHIYHNFFSVCALIPAIFMLSLGIILLRVPRKSKATLHLAITYVLLMIFYSGYIVAAMVYHPLAAYHRWITAGFATLSEIHFIMVFFYLPDEKFPRPARILGAVLYCISITMWAIFIAITYNSPKIFNFDGHYWDFSADTISMYMAFMIIAYLLILAAVGVWRVATVKTGERWTILAILLIIFFTILIPAGANLLSRIGVLDRGTYQITQDLFTIIGFFAVFIIYFNTTKERTSLLIKILGISSATMLIIIQAVSYYSLKGLDDSYDALRLSDMTLAIEAGRTPPGLAYLVEYKFREDRHVEIQGAPALDFTALRAELANTARIERIRNMGKMPAAKFRAEIGKILEGGAVHFSGYRDTILAHGDLLPADTADPAAGTIAFIGSIQKKTAAMSVCLSRLPEEGFAGSMESCLAGSDPAMEHFVMAIRAFAAATKRDGPALKGEVLGFVAPMVPAEQRRYRTALDGRTHYTAFTRFDPDRQVTYEAGFSYIGYREYHHRTARKFIIMFIIILIATFIGFRIFFLGAYTRPLRRLLDGITQVRKGNYDVVIPITMNDELGFITHNFNEMASTLGMSREALSDYSENLQKMVEERTVELEKARDTIWGEMELARKMQTILIPEQPRMTGYEIAGHMAPAEMVGGDYYDIINAAGMDWVVIGDVSGHGVPAGIIMMMVQTAIHTVLAGNPLIRPSDLLERVNSVITDNIQKLREDKYMTITVIACMSSGSLRASGLHQDILVYRSARDREETVKTCGTLLGLRDIIEYVPGDRELALEKNDIMLLYTDGITESWRKGTRRNHRNPRTDMFGQDRLADILRRASSKSPGGIRDAILEELTGYQLTDDVTMVIIKKT